MASPRAEQLRAALRYVRGVSRGVARGHIFPAEGRLRPEPAPGGSDDPPVRLGPLARAREEGQRFTAPLHTLPVPGLDAPVELLQVSDVHLRGEGPWLDALIEALRAQTPDLIVLTGDVVAREWRPEAVERFLAALPPARLGRFAIMGNWEYWAKAGPELWRPTLERHGVRLLIDEVVDLGPLVLAGTDDYLAGQPDLSRTVDALPPGRPAVVLTHSPGFFPRLVRPDVRLVLAGHSHAGQLRLPALGSLWVPKGTGSYISGWYRQGDTWLYVSRGVGWSIAPVRMWCPPELARIRLVPA